MENFATIKVSSCLDKLAFKLKKKADLFIVGGYVRNSLLKIENTDVDICSKLTVSEVKELLNGTSFVVEEKNNFLGTAIISCGDEYYEYSTFRVEKYDGGGAHTPVSVRFTTDIRQDAKRRDFTVNCIYYNITKKTLIDFYGGVKDVKDRIIRTIETPEYVFSHDGERILRMIRIACELNFKIDKKTFKMAEKMCYHLGDITPSRKQLSLISILSSGKKYFCSKSNASVRALNYFNKMQLWTFLGSTKSKIKFELVKKVKDNKLHALFIDIIETIKPDNIGEYLNYILGDNLNFSKKQIDSINDVICGYYAALSNMKNKEFFFKYYENFAIIGEILAKKNNFLYKKYNFFYKYIRNNNVPIQIKDLKINGNDIKKTYPKINEKYYKSILTGLLNFVFDGKIANKKDELLKGIKEYGYRNF